jgi:hypothetical protein
MFADPAEAIPTKFTASSVFFASEAARSHASQRPPLAYLISVHRWKFGSASKPPCIALRTSSISEDFHARLHTRLISVLGSVRLYRTTRTHTPSPCELNTAAYGRTVPYTRAFTITPSACPTRTRRRVKKKQQTVLHESRMPADLA